MLTGNKLNILWVIIYILLIAFIIFMVISFYGPKPKSPCIVTDYGIINTAFDLVYLSTPEEMGVMWCVIIALDGSGPVYRYFPNEDDAWTFYSMLRMTYNVTTKESEK